MPSAGFEPAIPAAKRPQTYALDRAATGIGHDIEISQDCQLFIHHGRMPIECIVLFLWSASTQNFTRH
jgi:hypothetical protein